MNVLSRTERSFSKFVAPRPGFVQRGELFKRPRVRGRFEASSGARAKLVGVSGGELSPDSSQVLGVLKHLFLAILYILDI